MFQVQDTISETFYHFNEFRTFSMSRTHMWMMEMRMLSVGTGPARRSTSSLRSAMLLDWEISGDFLIWPTRMEGVSIWCLIFKCWKSCLVALLLMLYLFYSCTTQSVILSRSLSHPLLCDVGGDWNSSFLPGKRLRSVLQPRSN